MGRATARVHETETESVGWNTRAATERRYRILVAEDDHSTRELVDWVLRDAGYDTVRVMDGQEAMEMVERCDEFDLLLTDLVMPGMSGVELALRLREINPHLKVLYFTGFAERLFKEKGGLWDDEACLEKPATPEQLVEAVAALLGTLASQPKERDCVPRRH